MTGWAEADDSLWPEGTRVRTPYPGPGMGPDTPRGEWPWMEGVIEEHGGPDEWTITVYDRAAAQLENGDPAPEETPEDDLWHPMAFRDNSEIRRVPEPEIHIEPGD